MQDDTYHLDISRDYLTGMDMVGDKWNGRKVNWHYISSPPTGCAFALLSVRCSFINDSVSGVKLLENLLQSNIYTANT